MELTLPIPTSLPSTYNRKSGVSYKNYQFTTASTVTGSFRTLRADDDDVNTPTHPVIRVGNIANAVSGAFAVTPEKTYEGDEGDYTIRFTAKGPIYDVDVAGDGLYEADNGTTVQSGDIDARIVVNLANLAVVDNLKMIDYPLPKTIGEWC